jgi:hypothetical protein
MADHAEAIEKALAARRLYEAEDYPLRKPE